MEGDALRPARDLRDMQRELDAGDGCARRDRPEVEGQQCAAREPAVRSADEEVGAGAGGEAALGSSNRVASRTGPSTTTRGGLVAVAAGVVGAEGRGLGVAGVAVAGLGLGVPRAAVAVAAVGLGEPGAVAAGGEALGLGAGAVRSPSSVHALSSKKTAGRAL